MPRARITTAATGVTQAAAPGVGVATPERPGVAVRVTAAPGVKVGSGSLMPGPPGPQGPPGPSSRWFVAEGPPTGLCGQYDFWLDTTTGDVWACGPATPAWAGSGRAPVTALVGRA